MACQVMGWQGMGKPDFSHCAKLFYRLPADLREGMNRSEEKVLIWTLFMSWTASYRSGRANALSSFSETWLGQRFLRSRWTVLRSLKRLETLSLLKRIRRAPKKDGTFQSNLIALSTRLSALMSLGSRQPREKTPCSKTAPQRTESEYKQERAATFHQSAVSSLSGSIANCARERTADTQAEGKRMEPGTLVKLFLKARAEKAG